MLFSKNQKKSLKALCVLLLVICATKSSEAQPLRVSYFNIAPFAMANLDTGEVTGASISLLKKIAEEMGVELLIDQYPTTIQRQMKQLESGKTDISLICVKIHSREKFMRFPDKPFHIDSPHVVVLRDSPLKVITKPEDLIGYKIGYLAKAYRSPLVRDKRLTFKLRSTPNGKTQNLKKLLSGRIDAVYTPESASALAIAKSLNAESKIRIIKLPESVSFYQGISKKTNPAIIKKYNAAFEKINGEKLFLKYLSEYVNIELFKESMASEE